MITFLQQLQKQVEQSAENLAVVDSQGAITYAELWRRAQELSTGLPSRGAHLVVGDRTASTVIRLVAAWLAGCVPLMTCVLTPPGRRQELAERLQDCGDLSVVEYLMSTSGSSGRPKLVMVPTGNLMRTLRQQIECFDITSESRVLWMLSPSFDASLSDIGCALAAGATLVCAPEGCAGHLPQLLSHHGITHLDIPPSVLTLYTPGDFPSSVRTLVVGGEPSLPSSLVAWSRYHRVVSVYGPTEATVCSSMSAVGEGWDAPYLGAPLDGVQYTEEDGQLLIGGPQVALGYLKETSHAFSVRDGVRWYATGDLVGRQHPRYGWEFLGRTDRQLKLHGQRIEPEELEQRAREILGHSQVAVVMVDGALTLVYAGEAPKDLAESLKRTLPAAWLPARYTQLDGLPRTESLKIDYPALERLLQSDPSNRSELDSLQVLATQLELSRGGIMVEACAVQRSGLHYCTGHQLLKARAKAATVSNRRAAANGSGKERKRLLITGATGLLGGRLRSLLEPRHQVWTLQRSGGGERSLQADLRLPDLGLSSDQWAFLSEEIDEIVHLAADTGLTKCFTELAAVNVEPLAAFSRLGKPLHLASSLAATLSSSRPFLQGPLDPEAVVMGGYAQSKWLAEAVVESTGLPGHTFRLGHLLDLPRPQEWLALVCRGLRAVGGAPTATREQPLYFDITPLDWAARQMAEKIITGSSGRQLHIVRSGWGVHYLDLIEGLERTGSALSRLSPWDFFARPAISAETGACMRALVALHPQREHTGWDPYDLFLLGRAPHAFTAPIQPQAERHLQRYLQAL